MHTLAADWRLYMALFGKKIIWRAEATWIDNRVHYHAVSSLFKTCIEGAEPPVYEFEFDEWEVTQRGGSPDRAVQVHAIGGSGKVVNFILPKREEHHEDDGLQSEGRGEEALSVEEAIDGTVEGREERST